MLQNVKAAYLVSQWHTALQIVTAKNVFGCCSMSPGGKSASVKKWSSTIQKQEFSEISDGSPEGGQRVYLSCYLVLSTLLHSAIHYYP